MDLLYENCANRAFKESFKLPNQSFFRADIANNSVAKEKKQPKVKINNSYN